MALIQYKQKRNKIKTPEPFGGKATDSGKLTFVIQKHAASHLHYDFRLEIKGVLKSWAVPKGPSTGPEVKRLAMMVEDHPYDYRNFEGIIPEGQYGGGTVIVWDEGTYETADFKGDKKEQEKHLLHGIHSGKIKFILHGKKLKGEFALVKVTSRGENAWLLMKLEDKYASKEDVTKKEKSVQSGKTIEKVKATSTKVWNSNRRDAKEKPKKSIEKKERPGAQYEENIESILKKVKRGKFPIGIKPMLATLVDEPFDDPDWIYEVKWDGYRTIGYIHKGKAQLLSRNNKSFSEKYYPIMQLMEQWKFDAVIDGEILVIDDEGVSNFSALQNWRSEADGNLIMYVFDLLWYNGKNLMSLPLSERQVLLKSILPLTDDRIRLSNIFPVDGTEFFKAARKLGLEGIMAKKADSLYVPDSRSKEWLKIKIHKRQEVVIGGFTNNEGSSKQFSSLLLGVYEKSMFKYVGKVGTGFTEKLQKELMAKFKPLVIKKCPFDIEPDVNKPSRFRPNPPKAKAIWLKPELVCEISFAEVTEDGVFRHPSFEGMRTDKKATEVIRENEAHTPEIIEEEKVEAKSKSKKGLVKAPKEKDKGTLLNPTEETQVKTICEHKLKFTNLSKVYWPNEGITKRDMFNYYYKVAEYILPYLKDRPQSLNRFPNGINGPSFYQKNVKDKSPDWVKTFPYTTSMGENKEFLVGADEATLLWMASLGCIEMNPWFSRIQSPDNPDYCIIDLDPDKNTFNQVIKAALEVKKVLDAIDVPSYPKTSGSTGMHIYIPLNAKYTYDQSQMFARLIVNIVHKQIPTFTSLERHIKNRKGKMYLDFLQNRPGATIACPYSLRPKPGATVSMPLQWEEVKPGLTMRDFTIHNTIIRLKAKGDLFHGVLGKGIDIKKALAKVESIFK
ncbi:MAG TPA: DNA ligase D [Flavipsychrobacter sp.]|nr:DNA ligase D [Flavipsychrobacter sp.]